MKPIKLIISAFGPYAGVTPEINFEKFEEVELDFSGIDNIINLYHICYIDKSSFHLLFYL